LLNVCHPTKETRLKLPLLIPSALLVLGVSSSALAEPATRSPKLRLARTSPVMQLKAPPRALPSTVSLEIRDTAPASASQLSRFALPLGDRGGAQIVSSADDHEYRINVRRDDYAPESPVMFDIERSRRGGDSRVKEAKLRAVVRMRPGQRVVVARIERADGSRTEVLATLK
jgi:hypothetical protein